MFKSCRRKTIKKKKKTPDEKIKDLDKTRGIPFL